MVRIILTERQKFILRDLLIQEDSIATKILAKKYNVSLRTVRYDLDNIEYWLKEKGSVLIKVPRVGVKVSNKEEAIKAMKSMKFNADEVLLSSIDRANIIILKLIFADKPLVSEELAEELYVSRSTVISTIKELNEDLKEYSISIEGKTNHGFTLTGEEKDIRRYIRKFFSLAIIEAYKEKLCTLGENPFTCEDLDIANDIVLLLKKEINIRLDENLAEVLKFRIMCLIRRIRCGNIVNTGQEEISRYKTTKIYMQAKKIYMFLVDKYTLPYEEAEIAYLSQMMLIEGIDTGQIVEVDFDERKLLNVVAEIVNLGFDCLNIKESEIETLSKELFSHLKITLSRYELNVISENPILEQIKAKYGDIFQVVVRACSVFKDEYNIELSEDEIGFITMYFLKSLEKSKTHVKKNILVVCNTSRGTSKLLATRIKNNIPEVNIKDIVSVIDIEKDEELIKDVDLIISTVKINNVSKPTITVSPIITIYELTKIREFLYLDEEYVGNEIEDENYIEDTLVNIIEKYTQKKNVGKLYGEITSLIGFYSNKTKGNKEKENFSSQTELIGLILIEISDMILKLYPTGMNQEEFRKVYGIIIHLIMAVARWVNGEYNQEKNIKIYEKKYPEKFRIIEETFNKISEKYKIQIKKTEIVAVLRYLI